MGYTPDLYPDRVSLHPDFAKIPLLLHHCLVNCLDMGQEFIMDEPSPLGSWAAQGDRPALVRPRERVVAGVARGLSDHLGMSASWIRFFFLISTPFFGFGILLYLWFWIFVPGEESDFRRDVRTITRKVPIALLLGLATIIVIITMYFQYPYHSINALGGILAVLLMTATVLWSLFLDPQDPNRSGFERFFNQQFVPLVVFLYSFILIGNIIPYASQDSSNALALMVYTMLFFYAFFLIVAAPVYRLAVRKISERELKLRREERSSMAAHLHDGVMQSLALIQNRAGAQTEVGRIARAQERALRDWLFGNQAPITGTLAEEVREIASVLELEYMATFDTVTVGEPLIPAETKRELLAAIREGMLNAAKHAGGSISVYLEGSPETIEINIRDRGKGFDVTSLPHDRFGVRDSLIGRVDRLGGKTNVTSTEQGTEVRITLPLTKSNGQS